METIKASLITCTVYRPVSDQVLDTMQRIGVTDYHRQSSRAVVLKRKSGFLGIGAGIGLEEELADRFMFLVPVADGEAALRALAASCDLHIPGRGTVFWENIEIIADSICQTHPIVSLSGTSRVPIQTNLGSVTCIVQHGQGNAIAEASLGLGLPMPLVTTGQGTGLRDRLGLIRVALPARKDVVFAVVSDHEATDVLGSLAEVGRLDRIGPDSSMNHLWSGVSSITW